MSNFDERLKIKKEFGKEMSENQKKKLDKQFLKLKKHVQKKQEQDDSREL